MRRAAVQALRTARRSQHVRRYRNSLEPLTTSSRFQAPLRRWQSSLTERGQLLSPLQSTLYLRPFTIFLASSLVGYGAWFAYKENPSAGSAVKAGQSVSPVNSNSIFQSLGPVNTFSTPITTANAPTVTTEEAAESTRRALVVENDRFFTGDIVGDTPLTKDTDASGRMVLEMLTPEQATRKLRQSEQSYIVGRGQGVVRYDVVQLPSNNPIEDDHAEKIVSFPSTSAPQDTAGNSDWMFWGVFDGHR